MQTDSTLARVVARTLPFSNQMPPSPRRQGSEDFDRYVEAAEKERSTDTQINRGIAENMASRPESRDRADDEGQLFRSTEESGATIGSADVSAPGQARTDSELAAQQQGEDGDVAGQVNTYRDPAPEALTSFIGVNGTDIRPNLNNGGPNGVSKSTGSDNPQTNAQTVRHDALIAARQPAEASVIAPQSASQIGAMGTQNPEPKGVGVNTKSGEIPLATQAGSVLQNGGGTPLTSRDYATNVPPIPALSPAQIANSNPDVMSNTPGQPRSAAGAVNYDLIPSTPVRAEILIAPPQAALQGSAAGLSTSDLGSILAASESRELSPVGLGEPGLPGGPSRSTENFFTSPQAARLAASQMAEALINMQGNRVEISLRPPELGRVRMVLSTSDAGVVVSITAERPETLDMMRRHIDQLADEFRRLGYTGIGFEFSGDQSNDGFDADSAAFSPRDDTDPDSVQGDAGPGPETITRAPDSRGLDLRL